jgi:hypothetical protein
MTRQGGVAFAQSIRPLREEPVLTTKNTKYTKGDAEGVILFFGQDERDLRDEKGGMRGWGFKLRFKLRVGSNYGSGYFYNCCHVSAFSAPPREFFVLEWRGMGQGRGSRGDGEARRRRFRFFGQDERDLRDEKGGMRGWGFLSCSSGSSCHKNALSEGRL